MTFVYDPAKGWAAELRNGQKVPRGRIPPPCKVCPKESPENAWQHELTEKNVQAVMHWKQHRAMAFNGMADEEKTDPIIQRNFGIIDDEFRRHERQRELQDVLIAARAAKPGGPK